MKTTLEKKMQDKATLVTEHCSDMRFHIPKHFFKPNSKEYEIRTQIERRGAVADIIKEDDKIKTYGVAVTANGIKNTENREKEFAKAISSVLIERLKNDMETILTMTNEMVKNNVLKYNPFPEYYMDFLDYIKENYKGPPKVKTS